MPNWNEPQDYEFFNTLSPEILAWQFLRRNENYQQDYRWFIKIWQSLEQNYGKAPNRDFNAWQHDPRAYRCEREIYGLNDNASEVCAAPENKLLIECWMGLKWGFYKFPVDPAIQSPILGRDLNWRTEPFTAKLYHSKEFSMLSSHASDNKIAVIFDLEKSLKDQIQSAKQQLLVIQRKHLQEHSNTQRYIVYCRILDAIKLKVPETNIRTQLALNQHKFHELKNIALEIQRENYLDIANSVVIK